MRVEDIWYESRSFCWSHWLAVAPLAEMWKSGRAADICMRGGSRENVLARLCLRDLSYM